jgi:uncharacterized protein (DUF885 family)
VTTDTAPAARPKTRIDAVADNYTDTLIRLNPSFATTLGVPGHETEYQDFSPAGIAEFAEAARHTLEELEGLEPEDEVDAVTLDAMRERLGLQLLIHASGWEYADLNNIASPAQDIRAIFDLMPTETEQHWQHIAGRALNVPAAIAGYMDSLRQARDAGRVAAARQVRIVIEQVTKYAAEDGFFAKLRRERPLPPAPCLPPSSKSSTPVLPPPGAPTPAWLTSSAWNCCPPRRKRTPWDGRATPWPPAPSWAPPWTWRRPTPGAWKSWTG